MKRFYVIFFLCFLLSTLLLYLSLWWFLGAVGAGVIVILYRFYLARLRSIAARTEGIQHQVEQLHSQLDNSILREERAVREAGQVKQAKQELLAAMSHEIRTPMNGVIGMAQLLSETTLTREQREYMETIRKCSEGLLITVNDLLVNDMLNFSKLDQEGSQLESKDFDLRNCLEEVLDLFSLKTAAAGIELVYNIDPEVPEQIVGDTKRLRQVLMNLVENAVKFTLEGEIFVGVHLVSSGAGAPHQLGFEVRDSGIGIGEDQLRQLFNGIPVGIPGGAPAGDPPKEGQPGSPGLGLVLCRTLVELMGGQIEVKSQLGKGSDFSFTMPLNPSQKPARRQAWQDLMGALENRRVLVVDDNTTSRDLLLQQLRSWKILPVAAASGQAALEILSKDAGFNLVLTDLYMPDMDGIELAKTIRGQYRGTPVVLMHPAGDERYRQDAEIFSSVLVKPLKQYMLRDHLLGILSDTGSPSPNKQKTMTILAENFSEQYPLRILVAEDNIINQKLAVKVLGKLGYHPELARNGKEVLEMISHEHYDLILMDVQMPEMDGLEATRMLRICLEIQPVVIAMTANAMQGDRNDCIQAGMDDYISKPIELKELLSLLEKWGQVIKNKSAQIQ